MSDEAMKSFMAQAARDPALAGQVRDAVAQHDGPQAVAALARIAKDAGHDVEAADVEAFRTRALGALEEGELTEESLERVSGGLFGVDDLLFAGAIGSTIALPVLGAAAGGLAAAGGVAIGAIVDKDFGKAVGDFLSKW